MQPTPVAFALAGPIGQGMDAFADALSLRHRFDPATSARRFTLSMSDIGEMVFLPLLMERVHALAPRLQIEVVEVPMEALPQALKDGGVDLAIGNLAGLGRHTRHAVLFSEHYVCMSGAATWCCRAARRAASSRRLDHILVASRASAHRLLDDAGRSRIAAPALSDPAPFHRRRRDRAPHRPDRHPASPRGAVVQPRARLRGPPLSLALPELTVTVHWHARFDSDPGSPGCAGR